MVRFPQISRVLRSASLFVVGVGIGALCVTPVAAGSRQAKAQAASVYTRSVSCSSLNFHPHDSVTTFDYSGAELYRTDNNVGSGFFICDPNLPNKAVVTKVQFTLMNNSAEGADIRYCALVRSGLKAAKARAIDVMAQVPTLGPQAGPTVIRLTNSTIQFATIDTRDHAYWLQCKINGRTANLAHDNLGIYGADVTYAISATNG